MAFKLRGLLVLLLTFAAFILSPAFAQAPAPPPTRPYLAKDVQQAMDFLANWARVPSGQELFKGASYVGSEGCKGCHDLQIDEWKKTWHSKILTEPTAANIKGNFNNAVVSFAGIRAIAKGNDPNNLGKLQNIPVKFDVRTETAGGKYFFVIVDPRDTATPKGGERFEVVLVVGGKWQQTYHVRPVGTDGKLGEFYFPAPIRWSVNPDKSPGAEPGAWELSNFQQENWVWFNNSEMAIPRKPTELPIGRFAEPRCMGCHTTGFDFIPPDPPPANQHWKMQGAGELAIGCERCHGPGSKHVEAAKQKEAAGTKLDPEKDVTWIIHGLKDLSLDQQSQVCGQCHARLGGKKQGALAFPDVVDHKTFLPGDSNLTERARLWSYAFPLATPPGTASALPGQGIDNFWSDGRGKKSRTTFQDHMSGAHAAKGGASCMTCHSLHGDAVSKDPQQESKLRQPAAGLCETCHSVAGITKQPNKEMFAGQASLSGSQHADQGVLCVDCHMGAAGQRMTATKPDPTKPDKPAAWDVTFHGTSIKVPAVSSSPSLDVRGSCEVCHTDQRVMATGTKPPKKTRQQLFDHVRKIQEATKAAIAKIQDRAKSNKNKDSQTVIQLSNAQANLNTLFLDGSMGFHNSRVSLGGVVSPQGGIAQCLRLANIWVELACRTTGAGCAGTPFNPISGPIAEPAPAVCLSP